MSDDPRTWYLKNHLAAMKKLEAELIERTLIAGGYSPPYTLEAYAARKNRARASQSHLYNHLVTQVNSLGVVIEVVVWVMNEQRKEQRDADQG